MGRQVQSGDWGTVGEVQCRAAVRDHPEHVRVGAVVAPVTGGAEDHRLGPDGLQKLPAGAVLLSVVAHLKEMGVQGSGIDAAVAQDIGVAGQQDAGAPVV